MEEYENKDKLLFELGYDPSEKAKQIITQAYDDYNYCRSIRNQRFPLLQEMTIEEYIAESQKRYVGYIESDSEELETEDAVEGRVFMPETRNKLNAILSYYTNQRMRVEFSARYKNQEVNKVASGIVQSLYDWSMDETNGDEQQYYEALECAVKGTVVVLEGWDFATRKVKYVTKNNFETGELEYEEKTIIDKNEPYSYVVPLESVYVPNVYQPDIQKQRYVIIEEELSHDEFMGRYGKYKNAKYVPCASMMPVEDREQQMFFYQRWNGITKSHMVKVLHRWDKWNDQYDVIANGILMTPEVNPFVFDHKQLPMVVQRFEILSPDFFYGLSFPMKLATEQDALNSLYNLFLMRTYASSNITIVTSQEDQIESDRLGPFYRIQLEDADNMRELQFRPISPGEISVMDKILESINKSSIDPTQQGMANAETATAIIAAREATNRLMGTFLNFLSWMTYKKVKLRVANLLQFTSEGSEEMLIGGAMKEDDNGRLMQEFRIRDQLLNSGKRGLRLVRIVHDGPLKSANELEEEGDRSEGPVEIFEVTPQTLRNLDCMFYVVPNSSTPPTKTLDKAMKTEYIQNKLSLFPDLSPRPKLSALLDETFDQNPEEMTVQEAPAQGMEQALAEMMGGAQGGPSQPKAGESGRPGAQGPSISQQVLESPESSLKKMTGLEGQSM